MDNLREYFPIYVIVMVVSFAPVLYFGLSPRYNPNSKKSGEPIWGEATRGGIASAIYFIFSIPICLEIVHFFNLSMETWLALFGIFILGGTWFVKYIIDKKYP